MKRIAFVTYRELSRVTDDDGLALEPLRRLGFAVESIVWDDPSVDLYKLDGLVLRSCWDYHKRSAEFSDWLERVESLGITLLNPPGVVRWNIDKRYLRELATKGEQIAPTVWLERTAPTTLRAELSRSGWGTAVVKPVISASGYQTWMTSAATAERDEARFQDLLQAGGVMVQKFMEEVRTQGEWSLLFFEGRYSHAVLKRPGDGDFRVQLEHGGQTHVLAPPEPLKEQAAALLTHVTESCTYARVDCVESGGKLTLMELELIEPFLFLHADPAAPDRFADAIAKALEG